MRLITIKKAAEMLNLPIPRLYGLIREGLLPNGVAVRFGRQLRLDADALEEWVRSGGRGLPGGWRRVLTPSAKEIAK